MRGQILFCKTCKTELKSRYYSIYCTNCVGPAKRQAYIDAWMAGEISGDTKKGLAEPIRRYLLAEANYICQSVNCAVPGGFSVRHPDDNSCVLEVNHIDGDGRNHNRDNLEVICPNCHALTSTYRARNKGRGTRTAYYMRVTI